MWVSEKTVLEIQPRDFDIPGKLENAFIGKQIDIVRFAGTEEEFNKLPEKFLAALKPCLVKNALFIYQTKEQ